jgi:hypothetical protein
VKLKVVKTGYSLAESSKEGYGSKRAVLLLMMIPNYAGLSRQYLIQTSKSLF